MKVLHINTFNYGGAYNAASQLCNGLRKKGCNAQLITQNEIKPVYNSKFVDKLIKSFYWRIIRGFYLKNYTACSSVAFPFFILKKHYLKALLAYKPDIIHFHWINDFIDYNYFFKQLAELDIPIVFTVHDRNILLGGYHYRLESDKDTKDKFNNIPLGNKHRTDFDNKIFNLKKKIFSGLNTNKIRFVAPSLKLKSEIANSYLGRFKIIHIPNSIDNSKFNSVVRSDVRIKLGVDREKKIILFCSYDLSSKWKGFDILLDAAKILQTDYLIIAIGNNPPKKSMENMLAFDNVNNDNMKLFYSAADVFVIPTLEDNLPNTVLESLTCGTPVIGSKVGGVPDMIREGITGMLFEPGNSKHLAQKIEEFFRLSEENRKKMSENCRNIAVEEYKPEVQARAYIELYNGILNAKC